MSIEPRHRDLLPLSGIAFVLLILLSITIGGSTPNPDASPATVQAFYQAHGDRQHVAAFALATSVPFLVAFAAAIARRRRSTERAPKAWDLITLGGGVLAATAAAVAATIHFALADAAHHVSGDALQALNVIDSDIIMVFAAGLGVMLLGAAGSLLSEVDSHPRLGWTALGLGVLLSLPFTAFFAILACSVWILATSFSRSIPARGLKAAPVAARQREQ